MNNIIIPYYIYHYENENENYGLVSYDNNLDKITYKNWKFYDKFYAFNPNIRPIPNNTKLFNLKIRNYYPYDIESYNLIYDIFSPEIKEKYNINLITYNRRVPNVKELYLHELNGRIYPSFEKEPPNNNKNWKLPSVNPIFVLKTNNNNFFCDNGICLPSPAPNNYFNKTITSEMSIENCLKNCKGGIGILELVKNISNNINKKYEIDNKVYFMNIYFISVIVFIFIFVIIILILNK